VKTEAVERMASAEKGVPVARSETDVGRFSNLQGSRSPPHEGTDHFPSVAVAQNQTTDDLFCFQPRQLLSSRVLQSSQLFVPKFFLTNSQWYVSHPEVAIGDSFADAPIRPWLPMSTNWTPHRPVKSGGLAFSAELQRCSVRC
jgi:hypothetical protein